MATNHPKAGPNSVPAYQLSGVPYVTQSAANEVQNSVIKLELPFVTRFFQVENTDASAGHDLRVGFSSAGVAGTLTKNYILVPAASKTDVLELRTKDLFFLRDGSDNTSFRVIAGLTTIQRDQFPILTGSLRGTGSFDGVG